MNIKEKRIVTLVAVSLLTALSVVLSRFLSVNMQSMSIGFSFLPIMLCGMLFGPLWGGVAGGLADLIGALLFPFGPYFPGFTATAFLSGMLWGSLKSFDGKVFFLALSAAVVLKEGICSLLLNTLWIKLLYGGVFLPLMITRLPEAVLMLTVEFIIAVIIKKAVLPPISKVMK